MKYRLLGRTGLFVSEICLGTMAYGGKGFWKVVGELPIDQVKAQLRAAVDVGINFIDTANIYHEGLSEELLGQGIRELGLERDQLVIASKVRGRMGQGPNQVGLSRAHIIYQAEQSLRRMGIEHIDLYQIHGVDRLTPLDETLRALDDLVRQGKVRYLGVSNHAAWQIMKALGLSREQGWSRFESIQAYYSIAGRELEREIVPLAMDQNLAILPWSPLAGGLLSGKFERGASPDGARRTTFDFPPVDKDQVWPILDQLRSISNAHDCSIARVALAYLLHKPAVTSIIIGARTQQQLEDNLASADLLLSEEEMAQLDQVSALRTEYPQWMFERQGTDRSPDATPYAPPQKS